MADQQPSDRVSPQPSRKSYACFISYKHGAFDAAKEVERGDSVLARAHWTLHRVARPWWKLRALHVFRDETILAADADLGQAITRALDDSHHLLLLASPQAAKSPWVRKELDYWSRTDPHAEPVILGLTAGDLVWDEGHQRFRFGR